MVFHWSFSESKSPQVSRTLLSILAVLNNAVVWMVSTRPPTSNSSSPFSNPLVTVPNAPITIGKIVTCMFHSFFSIPKQGRGTYPSFHILSDLFCGQPGQQSRQFCKISFLEFFTSVLSDVSHWSLSDSKSLFVSRTLLSILTIFSNAVVWIVSTHPQTSKSFRPF